VSAVRRAREVKEQQAKAKKKAAAWLTIIASVLLYVGGVVAGVVIAILLICWLKPEEFRNYTTGLQSIATILALFVGGSWVYWQFIQFREAKLPKIDLTIDVVFIRTQGPHWIITVEALLESKSKVRHQFEDFTFEIRHTLPADELHNKIVDDEITLSAKFPHVAAEGSWLNDAENPDDREEYGSLEPGESERRTFIACVPKNATMVRAHAKLFDEETDESWEAIKVVAVPGIRRREAL